MNSQNGMATLAAVSGILIVIALFSVSVASSGLGDIKKAQNLVEDTRQRANAKAGLDCAIAVFEQLNLNPTAENFVDKFNLCKTSAESSMSLKIHPTHWELISSFGYASYVAVIKAGSGEDAAFKTSGDLTIEGGHAWKSVIGEAIDDKFACTAIIAGGSVTIDVGSSDGASFNIVTPECADEYSTNVIAHTPVITNSFESDILVNQNGSLDDPMDLFDDLFGVPREQYQTVIDKYSPKQVDMSGIDMTTCGANIKSAISDAEVSGKDDFIWVKGDCQLDGISNLGTEAEPVTIVIQNGIVTVQSAVSEFKGTIFQYADNSMTGESRLDSWGIVDDGNGNLSCTFGMPAYVLCAQLINLENMTKSKWEALSFFFFGSFTSSGSYMVDVPGGNSIIRGSFSGGAPDDDNVYLSGKPTLVKGSIHDF